MLAVLCFIWFFLGAAVFSFLEVVICRLPAGQSVARGRSHCDACGKTLSAWELVPVFSWLAQRGRCRSCGAKLSAWYPAGEAFGGAVCIACALHFGYSATGVFGLTPAAAVWFAALCVLWTEARIDANTQELPDIFHILLFVLGVAAVWLLPEITIKARIIGFLCVSVPMFLLAFFTGGFGGGDIKLVAACGFLLGWKNELTAFAFAVLFGGLYGIWLLAARKAGKKDVFAFGPFLALGAAIAIFAGDAVREWYFGFLR